MKRKRKILKFLEDNEGMINSLMSEEERRYFGWHGVVYHLKKEIKRQVEEEEAVERSNEHSGSGRAYRNK